MKPPALTLQEAKQRKIEYNRQYKKMNRAKVKLKNKIWRENNPDKYFAGKKRWRKKYKTQFPEKLAANNKVYYAVSHGLIKRPDHCEKCGTQCKPHGHHHDYSKPLEVIWVCQPCHKKIHAEMGEPT